MRFPSLTRLLLEKDLKKIFSKKTGGKVLYIGSRENTYESWIKSTKFVTLDIDSNQKPDIVGDIHKIPVRNEQFNIVIAIEVLEHCHNPQLAINEMKRVLRKEGIMILAVPFLFHYHPCPGDYYRFTRQALEDLTRGFKNVEIISNGNLFTSIIELASKGILKVLFKPLNFLLAIIPYRKSDNPNNFIVITKK